MYDPQPAISKALYVALTTPALLLNNQPFNVYAHVLSGATQYVLIGEPIAVQAPGSSSCTEWDCAIQLSVHTRFEQQNIVSDKPAYDVSEQIMGRLLNQRLPLESGFTMSPIEVAFATNLTESDAQYQYVSRIIRLKFSIYQ